MKKTLLVLTATLTLVTSLLYLSSCGETDPCAKVDCGVHGTCNTISGTCDCETGYAKDINGRCDVIVKEQLFGDYTGEDFDTKGNSVTKYSSTIATVASDITKVTIKNLGNYECKNVTTGTSLDYFVEATVKGDSIVINNKTCNNQFKGSGYYDKVTKTLTINYTATYGSPVQITDVNKAVLKKK